MPSRNRPENLGPREIEQKSTEYGTRPCYTQKPKLVSIKQVAYLQSTRERRFGEFFVFNVFSIQLFLNLCFSRLQFYLSIFLVRKTCLLFYIKPSYKKNFFFFKLNYIDQFYFKQSFSRLHFYSFGLLFGK